MKLDIYNDKVRVNDVRVAQYTSSRYRYYCGEFYNYEILINNVECGSDLSKLMCSQFENTKLYCDIEFDDGKYIKNKPINLLTANTEIVRNRIHSRFVFNFTTQEGCLTS